MRWLALAIGAALIAYFAFRDPNIPKATPETFGQYVNRTCAADYPTTSQAFKKCVDDRLMAKAFENFQASRRK